MSPPRVFMARSLAQVLFEPGPFFRRFFAIWLQCTTNSAIMHLSPPHTAKVWSSARRPNRCRAFFRRTRESSRECSKRAAQHGGDRPRTAVNATPRRHWRHEKRRPAEISCAQTPKISGANAPRRLAMNISNTCNKSSKASGDKSTFAIVGITLRKGRRNGADRL